MYCGVSKDPPFLFNVHHFVLLVRKIFSSPRYSRELLVLASYSLRELTFNMKIPCSLDFSQS